MDFPPKRTIYPLEDWEQFLKEGKEEFKKRLSLIGGKQFRRSHFDFIKTIGGGWYGRVYLVRKSISGEYFAVKVMNKSKLIKHMQVEHAIIQKKILQSINFPFCIYLEATFQDNRYIFLCLPFIAGGDMFKHLADAGRFSEAVSMFFSAQVLLALEYLHSLNVLYRDLKPENILLDTNGNCKLSDFSFCKVVETRTFTLCGTNEYLSPEMLKGEPYGKSVDFWSYGVLLYEMSAGYPPFRGESEKTFEKILAGKYCMPRRFSAELRQLIKNLLKINVTMRLGVMKGGIREIKMHSWFGNIDWIALLNGQLNSPFVPSVKSPGDTSNFDCVKGVNLKYGRQNVYHPGFENF